MVFRRLKYEVAEEQLPRESQSIEAEMKNLNAELKQAKEEGKAAIKSAIAKLQNKTQAISDQLNKKISSRQGSILYRDR